MLVGYEANNALRNPQVMGDFCRNLVSRMASRYNKQYRALLFSTRINPDYKTYFRSFANVSTYVPVGIAKVMPSAWMRYRLDPCLKTEKVQIFHGLNEELPYHISRDIKTIITVYSIAEHHSNSLLDSFMWRVRMRYSYSSADVIVAVSDEVRRQLVGIGVPECKIEVIGADNPFEVTDEVVDRYFDLYSRLLK